MLLGAARDLTLVFLGIELMSVAVFVLAGLDRRRPGSAEAALKYFLLGAFSTAFMVYGMALLYGATGTTQLGAIAEAIRQRDLAGDPLLVAGTALLFVGFAFKVAAVPFHMWAPDVYQGAPTPYTAFMAAAVKVAAFAALARISTEALGPAFVSWYPVVWSLAAITMIAGNVLALVQTSVKRTLADLEGLASVRPGLAAAMTVFMLSFLGFPLAGGMGFFAKWYVLRAAMEAPGPLVRLALLLVLASVVSAGYYLGVVRAMYMKPRAADAPAIGGVPRLTGAVVAVAAVLTLALGLWPSPVIRWARGAQLAGAYEIPAAGPGTTGAVAATPSAP